MTTKQAILDGLQKLETEKRAFLADVLARGNALRLELAGIVPLAAAAPVRSELEHALVSFLTALRSEVQTLVGPTEMARFERLLTAKIAQVIASQHLPAIAKDLIRELADLEDSQAAPAPAFPNPRDALTMPAEPEPATNPMGGGTPTQLAPDPSNPRAGLVAPDAAPEKKVLGPDDAKTQDNSSSADTASGELSPSA
ncbi:MAG TPA: hypothetical protein VNM39_13265 [Verrucomicrobiae bacterium]|nr:hypothetical protein [Verrucomicrobiae bacterium]